MHLYTFPSQDSFITNQSGLQASNFGVTEILKIGATPTQVIVTNQTTSQSYNSQYYYGVPIQNFYGTLSGSFIGMADFFSGSITSTSSSFITSHFSGSINNITSSNFSGSIVSGSVHGYISGSLETFDISSSLSGSIDNMTGCFGGWLTGYSQIPVQSQTITNTLVSYRSLLQFDITNITNQVNSNNIDSFQCFLKLKTCQAKEVPIQYTIYALPVSQSWTMGNGYFSDGGSFTDGVSWIYRDSVNTWDTFTASTYSYISLNNTASAGGGGNWYTSSLCSQSFNYQTSDLNMDVTSIVKQWLTGSIVNSGIILISSAEVLQNSQGYVIDYFSEDTNTIYVPTLDFAWNNSSYITGSVETGSVNIDLITASISGFTNSSSSFISNVNISGSFSGSAGLTLTFYTDPSSSNALYSASGIIFAEGFNGNIINIPVIGSITGTISSGSYGFTGSCGTQFNAQLITGSFVDGIWTGSYFTGYYLNNEVENCILTGIYPSTILSNLQFSSYPTANSSYYTANVFNSYFNGDLIGTMAFYSTSSASFTGYFTDGIFNGNQVNLQFTGSIYTSSFYYTGSVNYITCDLFEIDITKPFTINVTDLNYTYKQGDVINVYINPTKKYPTKTFNRGFQYSNYSGINYLPSSSYYAIQDNITQEILIGFDDYTQLDCDVELGNYFTLDTSCLFPDREYQILIQVIDNGEVITVNTGKKFKIVK